MEDWIRENIVSDVNIHYEHIGQKHLIFYGGNRRKMGEIFIEEPPATVRGWLPLGNASQTESFFDRLRPLVERQECFLFLVSMPQNDYTVLHWAKPLELGKWTSWLLNAFEMVPWECGLLSLGLLIEGRGLIDISIRDGFEIAFYGSDDLWKEIHTDLWKE